MKLNSSSEILLSSLNQAKFAIFSLIRWTNNFPPGYQNQGTGTPRMILTVANYYRNPTSPVDTKIKAPMLEE